MAYGDKGTCINKTTDIQSFVNPELNHSSLTVLMHLFMVQSTVDQPYSGLTFTETVGLPGENVSTLGLNSLRAAHLSLIHVNDYLGGTCCVLFYPFILTFLSYYMYMYLCVLESYIHVYMYLMCAV